MHTTPKRPPWLSRLVIMAIVLLAAITLVFWWLSSQPDTTSFESREAHTRLRYDNRLRSAPLTSQDKSDKVVLRLVEPPAQPDMLITLRYETGLKPLTTAAKQDLRDALIDSVTKTYPQRFPAFHQVSSRSFEISSHNAYELVFVYKGATDVTVKQRFILVVVNDDQAVYLALQTRESNFESANHTYFDQIVRSLQLQ